MKYKIQVFISSKMQELAEERKALIDLLSGLSNESVEIYGWVYEGDAPASEQPIRRVYLDALRQSDLYIGIFWKQYGEWTIDEFNQASEWGIDRHIYVKVLGDNEEREDKLESFLQKHSNVAQGIAPKWFKDTDELCRAVAMSVELRLEERFPRYTAASAVKVTNPNLLPVERTALIGRDDLLNRIFALLEARERVLLHSHGGAGKTVLARQIADKWLNNYGGAIIWLQAGHSTTQALFEALARPFGMAKEIAGQSEDDQINSIRELLGEIDLLIIDDAWDSLALARVMKALPANTALLVTSRQRFELGEIEEVPNLMPDDALILLQKHAREYAAPETDARKLCKALGYLPFALQLAGKTLRRAKILPQTLLDEYENDLHNLSPLLINDDPTRATTTALIETSLKSLDAEVRRAFLTFGAFFAPSLTFQMLSLYLADDSPTEDLLYQLWENGLAEQVPASEEQNLYYRIHDLAYVYARTKVRGEQRNQAMKACLSYTERYNIPSQDNFSALTPELHNLIGAAEWAFQHNEWADVENFARWLFASMQKTGGFLVLQGHFASAIKLLEYAADAAEKQQNYISQGSFLGNLGVVYNLLWNSDKAINYFHQHLELARQTGDREGEGRALGNLGLIHFSLGDLNSAVDFHNRRIILAREIGDVRGEVRGLDNLGICYQELGDLEKALDYHQRSLDLNLLQIEDILLAGNTYQNLGNTYSKLGDSEKALAAFEEALKISREVRDRKMESHALSSLGTLYHDQKNFDLALEYHERDLEICRQIGDRQGEAATLGNIGFTYADSGQPELGIKYCQDAIAIRRELGDQVGEAQDLVHLGYCYEIMTQEDIAHSYYENAITIYTRLNQPHSVEEVRQLIANLSS